jgi:hypothetical protein
MTKDASQKKDLTGLAFNKTSTCFQQDINMFGEEGPRVAEISNETCQRDKILSHDGPREVRLALAAKVKAVRADAKMADTEQKIMDPFTRAEECRLLVLEGPLMRCSPMRKWSTHGKQKSTS